MSPVAARDSLHDARNLLKVLININYADLSDAGDNGLKAILYLVLDKVSGSLRQLGETVSD